ncbi:MAG: serine hydrolase domain-containing protein [Fluviicola sp.]|jgi:CubicO group peptidase (beta-lactamase class C family)
MKKTIVTWSKRIGWFLAILLITANLFILLSGRFYLYKGVYMTYLQGESGPTIYDLDKFPVDTILASQKSHPWAEKDLVEFSKADLDYMRFWKTSSFMVIHNDTVVAERYFNDHVPQTVSNSFSAAKTVVALLIGIALDEGKIKSLDEPLWHYLPKFKENNREKITIRHLLWMSSGLDWSESGTNPLSDNSESYYGWDLWGLVHQQQQEYAPGTRFNYQSGNTQLLGYVLEKATGESLGAYASRKLWQPLGAESTAFWSLDKLNGDPKAFCCLYSTTRDFARLGLLFTHHGNVNGKQIVSQSFLDEMVKNPKLATDEGVPNTRYGLHVWTYVSNGHKVVYYRGMKGQYVITIPEENLIIVRTGSKRAPNVKVPKNVTILSKAEQEMLDHPEDLFRYLAIGRRIVQESSKRK